ncbi:MAG: ACT domain-containing protein [candidate division NC10 bacterium]
MARITQLTVSTPSRPGVLARICSTLAGAGVNLSGICAAEVGGRGKIRMVVSDPGKAKKALADAKIRSGEEPALLLTLEDRPGTVAQVAQRLAAARINIKGASPTTPAGGGAAQVVLVVPNVEKAEKALG